jgi:hypothetical protein
MEFSSLLLAENAKRKIEYFLFTFLFASLKVELFYGNITLEQLMLANRYALNMLLQFETFVAMVEATIDFLKSSTREAQAVE